MGVGQLAEEGDRWPSASASWQGLQTVTSRLSSWESGSPRESQVPGTHTLLSAGWSSPISMPTHSSSRHWASVHLWSACAWCLEVVPCSRMPCWPLWPVACMLSCVTCSPENPSPPARACSSHSCGGEWHGLTWSVGGWEVLDSISVPSPAPTFGRWRTRS